MKFKTISLPVLFLCIFLTFFPHVLQAGPGEGWGVALGSGPLKPVDTNTGNDYQTTSILSDSLDYQWSLGQSFSFSFFSTENGGRAELPPKPKQEYYKTGLLIGAELRAWFGPFFLGIHGGQYYLLWAESLSSYSGIAQTGGSGYSLGFELESGWMIVANSEQSGTFEFNDMPDQKVEGTRILLGYRWR